MHSVSAGLLLGWTRIYEGKSMWAKTQRGGGARHMVILSRLEESLTTGSSLLPLLPSDVLLSEAQELGDGSRFSAEDRMTRGIIPFFFCF